MTIPTHLTDTQLVEALVRCAHDERHATSSLIAHLAEMDARLIHLREGFPSLFAYCCEVLRLSESATYKRIEVARAVRKHPVILERLCDGSLNLTTARLLAPHLTVENHRELLAAVLGRGKRAVEELLAQRFPRPDVASRVRKLPTPVASAASVPSSQASRLAHLAPVQATAPPPPAQASAPPPPALRGAPLHLSRRLSAPLSVPLATDRYQIRFTASASTWRKVCVARDLLRHAVPSGDPAEIFERALDALLADLARKKCAEVSGPGRKARPAAPGSRLVPANVRREVWIRDQSRCAYVSKGQRRCGERGFLEFHHVEPHAVGGPAIVANIELRCRAHNAYESALFFGERRPAGAPDRSAAVAGLSVRGATGPGASCAPSSGVEGGVMSSPRSAMAPPT